MSTRTPKPAPSSPVSLKALIALQQQIAKNEANRRKEAAIDAMRNIPTSGAIVLLNERLNEQRPNSSNCHRITSEASELGINAVSQTYISNYFAQLLYYAAFVATPAEISNAYTDSIRINGAVFSLKTFLLQFAANIDSEGDFDHLSKTLHDAFLNAANEATNPYFADTLKALTNASERITQNPAYCLKTLRGSAVKGDVFKMPTVKQISKLASQTKPKFDTGEELPIRKKIVYCFGSEMVMNRDVDMLADSALHVAICQVPFLDRRHVYVRTPLLPGSFPENRQSMVRVQAQTWHLPYGADRSRKVFRETQHLRECIQRSYEHSQQGYITKSQQSPAHSMRTGDF